MLRGTTFIYTRQYVIIKLEGFYQRNGGFKGFITLHITLKKRKIENGETFYEFKNVYFNSKTFTITNIEQLPDAIDQAIEEILNRIAGWISEGSGWTIERNDSHYVNVSR